MYVNFNILNQLGSPSLNSNTFANRPAAGQTGRLFISTDTFEIYRDNGTGWDLIGTGTGGGITGSGTANQVTYWTGTSAVGGESAFTYNPSTNALRVDGNISLNRNADAWTPNNVFTVGNGSFTSDVGGTYLTFNAYYNVDWKYSQNGVASFYAQANGGHIWYNASSGTAGNNLNSVIAMYLDDKENLGVATAPPNWYTDYNATIINTANIYGQKSTTVGGITSNAFLDNTALSWRYQITGLAARMEIASGAVNWFTAPSGTLNTDITFTRRLRLTNDGHLNFNTADTTWGAATRVIHLNPPAALYTPDATTGSTNLSYNYYYDGTNERRIINSACSRIYLDATSITFNNAASGAINSTIASTNVMRINSAANVLIGTITDAGQRLQVNGTTFLSGGTTTIRGAGATVSTYLLELQNSTPTAVASLRDNGRWDWGSSGNVTMGAGDRTTAGYSTVGGSLVINSLLANPGAGSDIYITGGNLTPTSGTLNTMIFSRSFVPTSGTAVYNLQLIQPTINQTGGANGVTRGIQINPTLTAASDWRSIEISNNSGWGIYQSGASANNYFNGDVLVGTTTDSGFKFDVNGSTRLNGTVQVDGQTSGTAGGASGQHLIINCDGTTYKIALLNN